MCGRGASSMRSKMQLPTIPGGGWTPRRARTSSCASSRPSCCVRRPMRCISAASCKVWARTQPRPASARVSRQRAGALDRCDATAHWALWNARIVEFYGCTEASACRRHVPRAAETTPATTDEDIRSGVVDPDKRQPVPVGQRRLTVCTNLNPEARLSSIPGRRLHDLRHGPLPMQPHPRASRRFVAGRADGLINLHQDVSVQVEQACGRCRNRR